MMGGWAVTATVLAALAIGLLGCGEGSSPPPGGVALKEGGELAAWSPEGRLIAAPGTGDINLVGVDGSVVRRLAVPGIRFATWPCECRLGWSQNGRRILFLTRRGPGGAPATVGSVGLKGGSVRREPLGVPAGDAAWSPQGWPLVFVANSGAYEFNTPHRGLRPDLWRLDSLGAKPYRILSQAGSEIRPQFSPDGTKILYVRKRQGDRSVWVVDADGSNPHPLATGLTVASAVWAPDSKRVAVAEGGGGLCVGPVSARALNRVPGVSDLTITVPAWTPDGSWITYGGFDGTIWRTHPDGTGRERIGDLPAPLEIRRLLWSPDGKHLAYAAIKREEEGFD